MRIVPSYLAAFAAAVLLFGAAPVQASFPALDHQRGVMTMAPLLERATPAVVNISVTTRIPVDENPLFRDPLFRRFFDLPERPPERKVLSAGSGVIVDADGGYVLTNHHVVDRADRIAVTLEDRRRFETRLIGSDPATDLALLQIEPNNLVALSLGDSDRLKVGDLVVAIGNPFGLGETVTSGIVSALGRSCIGTERYDDFIHTDAPINPGNSGGALIDTRGYLIGINTAIIAPRGGSVGIGFAVPSNMARAVMDQLLRHGEVRRGRIGVQVQDVTPDLAEALGVPTRAGAVIAQVEAGSSAALADLRPGDVIVAVDGAPVTSATELRNRVGLTERGTWIQLDYYRDGRRMTATLEVGAPDATAACDLALAQLAGAGFSDIPEGHAAHGRIKGVLVGGVVQGSPAWRFGLREGDVVLAINRHRVRSSAELEQVAREVVRAVVLDIQRGDIQRGDIQLLLVG